MPSTVGPFTFDFIRSWFASPNIMFPKDILVKDYVRNDVLTDSVLTKDSVRSNERVSLLPPLPPTSPAPKFKGSQFHPRSFPLATIEALRALCTWGVQALPGPNDVEISFLSPSANTHSTSNALLTPV